MSEAACKLKLCVNRADAEVASAFMIAPQVNGGVRIQELLDSFMSESDQQEAIYWAEQLIDVFSKVNAKLVP